MKINVIPLRSDLSKSDKNIDLISKTFLENINDELFDYDLILETNVKEALMSVFLIETGGSENKFLKYTDSLKDPVILLSTERNNSLPACFEIKTYLEKKGFNCLLLNGSEKDIAAFFIKISEILIASDKLNHANLGLIGNPSDWLIASNADYGNIKSKFGINIIKIGLEELFDEINKKKIGNIPHLKFLKNTNFNQEELNKAFYVYSALKRLVDKYHLSGLTIRCFDLLKKYKTTACLALALLNEEGIISGCEGDVPSLITMMIIKALSNQNSFMANPASIDFKNNKIILAHCTAPINMLSEYKLDTHFESNLGVAIKGNFYQKDVTVCKITPDLEDIVILQGNIVNNLSLPFYCRSQIEVEINENRLISLLDNSFGNHLIVVYGDIVDSLLSYFSFVSLPKNK